MSVRIEVSREQANVITVDCLSSYYMQVYEESYDSHKWDTLIALDTVISHFMTPNQYEDFNNGLREYTPTM